MNLNPEGGTKCATLRVQREGEERTWNKRLNTGEVAASKLKVIVLVPVLQRECRQRRRVGKLQVGKVPVEDLTVP